MTLSLSAPDNGLLCHRVLAVRASGVPCHLSMPAAHTHLRAEAHILASGHGPPQNLCSQHFVQSRSCESKLRGLENPATKLPHPELAAAKFIAQTTTAPLADCTAGHLLWVHLINVHTSLHPLSLSCERGVNSSVRPATSRGPKSPFKPHAHTAPTLLSQHVSAYCC